MRDAFDGVIDACRRWGPSLLIAGVVLAVVVALAVLPARNWMNQREELAETREEHERLLAEVAELEAQQRLLETDAEVVRQARENYDLVYPGEESYRILPAD